MAKRRQSKHVPKRTCVACRNSMDKRLLIRVVRTLDDGIVVDFTGKRNGRGAYLCGDPACWDKAMSSRILDQALRTEVSQAEKEALMAYRPSSVPQDE